MATLPSDPSVVNRRKFLSLTGRLGAGALAVGQNRLARGEGRSVRPSARPHRNRFNVLIVNPTVGWRPIDWQDSPAVYSTESVVMRGVSRGDARAYLDGYNCVPFKPGHAWAIMVPARAVVRLAEPATASKGGAR